MICFIRCNNMKCAKLPLYVHIIIRVIEEFCANVCFHKFVFCDRRYQDMTKAIFNCGTGRNKE